MKLPGIQTAVSTNKADRDPPHSPTYTQFKAVFVLSHRASGAPEAWPPKAASVSCLLQRKMLP